jgi:DNA-binding LytR/AlgR family response regulator
MRKTVLIIEDHEEQARMLKALVLTAEENTEVLLADNVTCAYQLLMEKTIDVFLVDIILDTTTPGDTSGIRLVERVRQVEKYMFTPVIFVTSMEDPTMYAYTSLNCIDYIEKPFDPARVVRKVEHALHYTTEREKDITLTFKKDNVLYPVKLKEIVYMESTSHVMYIHLTNSGTLEIPYKTCRKILEEEDTAGVLVQCRKGTLVNREHVELVDATNRYLVLKENRGMVEIGGKYKKKVLVEFGG